MHPAFSRIDHRPWALPQRRWTWRQSWCDLLFVHWPIPAAAVRTLVAPELVVQEFEGTSWIGVVPFRMAGVMRRPFPDVPGLSAFPELNVRLYVETDGKPGVWFLSLDAANPIAVWAARRFFHLPYFRAQMSVRFDGERFRYSSQRMGSQEIFKASYRATGEPYESTPGTLEHWLTERYCLYTTSPDGTLLRNEVHHAPWPLQAAELELESNAMIPKELPASGDPVVHFARRLDVVVWDAEVCGVAGG